MENIGVYNNGKNQRDFGFREVLACSVFYAFGSSFGKDGIYLNFIGVLNV